MAGPVISLDGIQLPTSRTGWHNYAFSALLEGNLAILRTRLEPKVVQEKLCGDDRSVRGIEAAISIFDGHRESGAVAFSLEEPFPRFDRLSGKHWIIANARCAVGQDNARILSGDGQAIAKFCLGDGINHLQCDTNGGIWVGYFDEGVFGNQGWGAHVGGPDSPGAAGIALFSSSGVCLWGLNTDASAPQVSDCYALNVHENGVHACYYTDFAIVAIDRQRKIQWRANRHRGVSAVAFDQNAVLLAGGYQEDRDRIVLTHWPEFGGQQKSYSAPMDKLRFEKERVAKLALTDIYGKPCELFVARGPRLQIVSGNHWHRLTVMDALAQIHHRL